jgi:hypothetical protein
MVACQCLKRQRGEVLLQIRRGTHGASFVRGRHWRNYGGGRPGLSWHKQGYPTVPTDENWMGNACEVPKWDLGDRATKASHVSSPCRVRECRKRKYGHRREHGQQAINVG